MENYILEENYILVLHGTFWKKGLLLIPKLRESKLLVED
jgi:hypothetical protein